MDKLSPLSGISAALKNSKLTESIDKLKSSKKSPSVSNSEHISLEQYVVSNLRELASETPKETELIQVFIKGVLSWEFGFDIKNDISYQKLEDKIVNDINNHPALSKQILKLIKELK
ncbi:MAG: hypothetical protein ACI9T9_002059 [Oleiphilaceae bacterium]|jgi:hypothetical protein